MLDFVYDVYILYFVIFVYWDNNYIKLLNIVFFLSKLDDKCIFIFINILYILKCFYVLNFLLMLY